MIQIAPVIRTELLKHADRVYLHNAPATKVFPYVVFHFPTCFSLAGQDILNLDVDVWDNSPDTTTLDTLARNIWNSLDRLCHIDNDQQFSIFRMNRLMLDDDDPQIQRRKLIFQLRLIDRGNS